jgi:hypothetical protein
MPPRKVFVNLASHVANGEEVTVTTTKSANNNGTRRANWSVSGARGNVGGDAATLVTASPAVEELPVTPGQRIFKNRVKLPAAGGDRYTVTAKKVHDNATVGSSRTLTGVQLEAWRKLYFTINCMAGLEAWAARLGQDLPAMLLPAFVEVEQKAPVDATPMASVNRVDHHALKQLVQALPAEPYAGQRPADPDVQPLWMRLALVRTFLGEEESAASEVAADEVVVAGDARRITKRTPLNWMYASPGSVRSLELAITRTFALDDAPAFEAKTGKISNSTSTSFTVTVDQADVVQAAGVVRDTPRQDVALHLVWASGKEERLPATDIDDDGVYFTWQTSGNGHAEKARWSDVDNVRTKAVEVKTRRTIAFADGAADEGAVTINDAGNECVVEVTDEDWVAQLDEFRAGTLANATLKVQATTYRAIAGQSRGGNIAIAVDDVVARAGGDEGRAQQLLLRVILHEIIHAVGGVVQDMADGGRHTKYYPEGFGGVATAPKGHCATGTTLTRAATLQNHTDEQKKKTFEPGKDQVYVPSSSTICLMYHRAYVPHFITAPLCSQCLRAFRLTDLNLHITTTY